MSKGGIEREAGVETAAEVRRVEDRVRVVERELEELGNQFFAQEPASHRPGDFEITAASTIYMVARVRPRPVLAGGTVVAFRCLVDPGVDAAGVTINLTITLLRNGFLRHSETIAVVVPTTAGPFVPYVNLYPDMRDRDNRPGYAISAQADAVGDTTPPSLRGILLAVQP